MTAASSRSHRTQWTKKMKYKNEYTNNKAAAASVVTATAMFPLHEFMVQSQSNSEDEPSV